MTNEELKQDLQLKIKKILETEFDINHKLNRLIVSGSGVLEAHSMALENDYDYLEPRKVILAMMKDFTLDEMGNGTSREFKRDVDTYYTLL